MATNSDDVSNASVLGKRSNDGSGPTNKRARAPLKYTLCGLGGEPLSVDGGIIVDALRQTFAVGTIDAHAFYGSCFAQEFRGPWKLLTEEDICTVTSDPNFAFAMERPESRHEDDDYTKVFQRIYEIPGKELTVFLFMDELYKDMADMGDLDDDEASFLASEKAFEAHMTMDNKTGALSDALGLTPLTGRDYGSNPLLPGKARARVILDPLLDAVKDSEFVWPSEAMRQTVVDFLTRLDIIHHGDVPLFNRLSQPFLSPCSFDCDWRLERFNRVLAHHLHQQGLIGTEDITFVNSVSDLITLFYTLAENDAFPFDVHGLLVGQGTGAGSKVISLFESGIARLGMNNDMRTYTTISPESRVVPDYVSAAITCADGYEILENVPGWDGRRGQDLQISRWNSCLSVHVARRHSDSWMFSLVRANQDKRWEELDVSKAEWEKYEALMSAFDVTRFLDPDVRD